MVKAVGLVDTLTSYGLFTLFAPNFRRFRNCRQGPSNPAEGGNKAQSVSSFTSNVVPCAQKPGDIAGKKMDVKTVQGAVINVNTKSGAIINNSSVETADFEACNGAIHVMDPVIQPPG